MPGQQRCCCRYPGPRGSRRITTRRPHKSRPNFGGCTTGTALRVIGVCAVGREEEQMLSLDFFVGVQILNCGPLFTMIHLKRRP